MHSGNKLVLPMDRSPPFLHFDDYNNYFFLLKVWRIRSQLGLLSAAFLSPECKDRPRKESQQHKVKCFIKKRDRVLDKVGKPQTEKRMKEEGGCLMKSVLMQRDRCKNR